MADNIYDLRKYNIKDMKDALAFLELVEARIPQIIKVVRKQSLVEASLKNRLDLAENRPAPAAVISEVQDDKNTSVLKQLTNPTVNQRPDASRIAQMKSVSPEEQQAVTDKIKRAANELRTTGRVSPITLAAPGEIGTLNIPEPEIQGEVTATVTEGEGDAAAGSKSELATDESVQQEGKKRVRSILKKK